MSQIVYVTVKLVLEDSVDYQEVVNEVDYTFDHEAIQDAEIVDVEPIQVESR